jgi:hypothetical protein
VLTTEQRRAHYAFIQNGFRIRSRNLRKVIEAVGGWEVASLIAGKSTAQLRQVCCSDHPWHRTIGDKLARELEQRFKLVPGALDRP